MIGICGGYQFLGQRVRDPLGVESHLPETPGLGLLPLETTMVLKKITSQVEATFLGLRHVGSLVAGYEIHMGRTEPVGEGRPVFRIERRVLESVDLVTAGPAPISASGAATSTACSTVMPFAGPGWPICAGRKDCQTMPPKTIPLPNFKKNSLTSWPRQCGKPWISLSY